MRENHSAFWTFSLAVYGDAAVQRECLDLQDRCGVNINLLLLCAFVGAVHAKMLSLADLRQAEDVVRGWHSQVVECLRTARRAIKSFSDASPPIDLNRIYGSIKEQELEAERLEQLMLEHWSCSRLHAWPKERSHAAAAENIKSLFDVCCRGGAEHPDLPYDSRFDTLRIYPAVDHCQYAISVGLEKRRDSRDLTARAVLFCRTISLLDSSPCLDFRMATVPKRQRCSIGCEIAASRSTDRCR